MFVFCLSCTTSEFYKGYALLKTLKQIQVGNEVEDINMKVDHTDSMPPYKMKMRELSDFFKNFAYIYKKKKEM